MKALQSLSGLHDPDDVSRVDELIKYHEYKIYKNGNRNCNNNNNGSNGDKTDNGNALLPSSDSNDNSMTMISSISSSESMITSSTEWYTNHQAHSSSNCPHKRKRRQSLQTSLPAPIIPNIMEYTDTYSNSPTPSLSLYGGSNRFTPSLPSIINDVTPSLIETDSIKVITKKNRDDIKNNSLSYQIDINATNSERGKDTPHPYEGDNHCKSKTFSFTQKITELSWPTFKPMMKMENKCNTNTPIKKKARDSVEIGPTNNDNNDDGGNDNDNDNNNNCRKMYGPMKSKNNNIQFPKTIEPFYKLLKEFDWDKRGLIGSGGQSQCFMVIKKKNGINDDNVPQIVAIKVTPFNHFFDDEKNNDNDDRYIQENKLLHIYGGISTYKIYVKHSELSYGIGEYYFVQDLVDVSLHDVIHNKNSNLKHLKYEEREMIAKSYIYQILDKLNVIHENGGLIHGDLKPSNILIKKSISGGSVSTDDDVKIIDFGLSKKCDFFDSIFAECGYFFGTLGYAAPEMYKYKQMRYYDHKIDIYSVGILLIEIIMMKNPLYYNKLNENAKYLKQNNPKYFQKSLFELQMRIYWQFVKKLNIKNDILENLKWEPNMFGTPGVSPQCIDFIEKCLEINQTKRWTAKQLLKHEWFSGD